VRWLRATLTLTITDETTNATFSQPFTVDIPAILGGMTGFVGFTASTDELTSVQKILNWQFSSSECCTAGEPSFAAGFPTHPG